MYDRFTFSVIKEISKGISLFFASPRALRRVLPAPAKSGKPFSPCRGKTDVSRGIRPAIPPKRFAFAAASLAVIGVNLRRKAQHHLCAAQHHAHRARSASTPPPRKRNEHTRTPFPRKRSKNICDIVGRGACLPPCKRNGHIQQEFPRRRRE